MHCNAAKIVKFLEIVSGERTSSFLIFLVLDGGCADLLGSVNFDFTSMASKQHFAVNGYQLFCQSMRDVYERDGERKSLEELIQLCGSDWEVGRLLVLSQ